MSETNTQPPAMEWPDKRVWVFLAPMLIAMALWAVLPESNPYTRPAELTMYGLLLAFGLIIGGIGLKEGRSLMRPSILREQDPQLFKIEIWVGCFASAAFAVWELFSLLK